jgi:ribosome-binding protein aMBF1 (putative translation factor)
MESWNDVLENITFMSKDEIKGIRIIAKMVSKLIERRKELGWTKKELAKKAGYKKSVVEKIENSPTVPKINKIIRLAIVMDLDIELVTKK